MNDRLMRVLLLAVALLLILTALGDVMFVASAALFFGMMFFAHGAATTVFGDGCLSRCGRSGGELDVVLKTSLCASK